MTTKVKDCRLIDGDDGVIISQSTAIEALYAMENAEEWLVSQ